MIKVIKFAALIGALTLTSVSVAEAANPGFYVGGQLGRSTINYDYKDFTVYEPNAFGSPTVTPESGNVDKRGVGGRVFLGYQFDPNWAVELGYTQYASADARNLDMDRLMDADSVRAKGEIDQRAVDLVGKAILPVSDNGNIYAKAGIAYVKADQHVTATGYDAGVPTETFKYRNTVHKTRPTFAIGGSMDINPQVPIFIEWSRVTAGGDIANSDLISVGVAYHFS